jgi:ABC-type amino acid transport substrate-binding protein
VLIRRAAARGFGVAAATLLMASCGAHVASVPPLPPAPNVEASGPAVSRIQHDGTLRVAADLSYPPMAFRADSGPRGFDVDVATLLAQSLRVHLAVVDTPLAVVRLGVPSDTDMAIGALPSGAMRGRASAPYYMMGQAIVSPSRQVVGTVAALRGLRVAAAAGSVGASVAERAGASATALTFLPEQALSALVSGQAQATVVDDPLARGNAATHPGLVVTGIAETSVPLVAVVPQNESDLAGFVSDALKSLGQSGGLARLRERWHL